VRLGDFFCNLGDFWDKVSYSLVDMLLLEEMEKIYKPSRPIKDVGVDSEKMDIIMEWSKSHIITDDLKKSDDDNNLFVKNEDVNFDNIINFDSYKVRRRKKNIKNPKKDY